MAADADYVPVWDPHLLEAKNGKLWQQVYALDYKAPWAQLKVGKPGHRPTLSVSNSFLNSCKLEVEYNDGASELGPRCFVPGARSHHFAYSANLATDCDPCASVLNARAPITGSMRDHITNQVSATEVNIKRLPRCALTLEDVYSGPGGREGVCYVSPSSDESDAEEKKDPFYASEERTGEAAWSLEASARHFPNISTHEELLDVVKKQAESLSNLRDTRHDAAYDPFERVQPDVCNVEMGWGEEATEAVEDVWRHKPEVNYVDIKCLPLLTGSLYADMYALCTLQHSKRFLLTLIDVYVTKIYPVCCLTQKELCDTGFDLLIAMAVYLDGCVGIKTCTEAKRFYSLALRFQKSVLARIFERQDFTRCKGWYESLGAIHSYCSPLRYVKVTRSKGIAKMSVECCPRILPLRALDFYSTLDEQERTVRLGHDIRFAARYPQVTSWMCDYYNTIDYKNYRQGSVPSYHVPETLDALEDFFVPVSPKNQYALPNLPEKEKISYEDLTLDSHHLHIVRRLERERAGLPQPVAFSMPRYYKGWERDLILPEHVVKGLEPHRTLYEIFPDRTDLIPCPSSYNSALAEASLDFNPSFVDLRADNVRQQVNSLYGLLNMAFCPNGMSDLRAAVVNSKKLSCFFESSELALPTLPPRTDEAQVPNWWNYVPDRPDVEAETLWKCLRPPHGEISAVLTGNIIKDWPAVRSRKCVVAYLCKLYDYISSQANPNPKPLIATLIHDAVGREYVGDRPYSLFETKAVYLKLLRLYNELGFEIERAPTVSPSPRSFLHAVRLLKHEGQVPFCYSRYLFHEAASLHLEHVYKAAEAMALRDFEKLTQLAAKHKIEFTPSVPSFNPLQAYYKLNEYFSNFFSLYPNYPGCPYPLHSSYGAVVTEGYGRTNPQLLHSLCVAVGSCTRVHYVNVDKNHSFHVDFNNYKTMGLEYIAKIVEDANYKEAEKEKQALSFEIR